VAGTVAIGTVVATPSISVPVTGLQAIGRVGSVIATTSASVSVKGVQGTGQVGSVLIWEVINDNQTPNWTIIRTAA
jgi:hypothetical protein